MGITIWKVEGMSSGSKSEAPAKKVIPFWKNLVAGGGAGVLEVIIMYPLDVVKTRSQLATGSSRGVLATLSAIVKEEGFARLYRGLSSPIVAEAPKRAAKFTFNEKYKQLLGAEHYALAGTLAGMSEATVNCPFEVVKVRMQAKENLGKYSNTMEAAIHAVKTDGVVRGLFRGFVPQALRNGAWNGTYFGVIGYLRTVFPSATSDKLQSFAIGVIGGAAGTTLNTPLDVVKSRMQNATTPLKTFPTLGAIYRGEGFKALYRGYVARLLRLGPGGGVMLVAFDYILQLLD